MVTDGYDTGDLTAAGRTIALQVAPLNNRHLPAPKLLTYTVSDVTSIAIPLGSSVGVPRPTVIVGHGPGQRETSRALQ